jgi:hypothetical protein
LRTEPVAEIGAVDPYGGVLRTVDRDAHGCALWSGGDRFRRFRRSGAARANRRAARDFGFSRGLGALDGDGLRGLGGDDRFPRGRRDHRGRALHLLNERGAERRDGERRGPDQCARAEGERRRPKVATKTFGSAEVRDFGEELRVVRAEGERPVQTGCRKRDISGLARLSGPAHEPFHDARLVLREIRLRIHEVGAELGAEIREAERRELGTERFGEIARRGEAALLLVGEGATDDRRNCAPMLGRLLSAAVNAPSSTRLSTCAGFLPSNGKRPTIAS